MAKELDIPLNISGTAAQFFKAREAWEAYRKNNNIVNPYEKRRTIENQF